MTDSMNVVDDGGGLVAVGWARRAGRLVIRVIFALAVAGAGVEVWLHRLWYRSYEAVVGGWVSHLLIGSAMAIYRPQATFFLNVGTRRAFGITVSPECTSATVTALILVVTAVIVVIGGATVRRAITAAIAATATFALCNLIRLVMIATSTDLWGTKVGFHWSHVWAGTFLTVAGGVASVVIYMIMLGRGPSRLRRSTVAGS
jgi:exosortase/archaeosortase family protein